jgi:twitching motility protein PilT
LKAARHHLASDIHLSRGVAPLVRTGGDIRLLEGPPITSEELTQIFGSLVNARQHETFQREMQLCFSSHREGLGRFRVAVYSRAGLPEFSIRLCESRVRSLDELGLPDVIDEWTRLPNGLILVTGPTGMGKTTTLNYMVNTINEQRRAKIVMIEDPVEFEHQNKRSLVIQQEVLTDVPSFKSALRNVLRQDPDIIVIGEMRDLETIETALTAAETGHLVLATLHTPDSVQTIQRIVSVFPAEQQNAIIVQLASSLQAVFSQKLLPTADGKRRVLAYEVCIATHAVRNQIRERSFNLIYNELQTGKKHKMCTLDSTLLDLYQRGEITYDMAMSHARETELLRRRIAPPTSNMLTG